MKLISAFILTLLLGQGPCCHAAQELMAEGNLGMLNDQTDLPISDLPATDQEATDTFDNSLDDNLDFIPCTVVTSLIISKPERVFGQDNLLLERSSYPPFLPPETILG